MMKTPEEIKKGLEVCGENAECGQCPYFIPHVIDEQCVGTLFADALALVQQLERERDAAVRDMYHAASDGGSFCDICKYNGEPCDRRKFEEMECWQWRGVEEAEG